MLKLIFDATGLNLTCSPLYIPRGPVKSMALLPLKKLFSFMTSNPNEKLILLSHNLTTLDTSLLTAEVRQ